ncbi:MAG TPA: cyclic 2,3-diphosphoglycerate synthase [Vicinamibacteria bacterium]|nr:cyclic 2,3-diphosphoglycerate synthase [Vicinamibacteria bacterium]
MGAAGRDFHNFNTVFREDPSSRVVAFTATQIPNIDDRRYPKELAGPLYPDGIPIHPESDLPQLVREHGIDQVVFAYSDVSHETVMHKASLVLACGADFRLIGPKASMIGAKVPVVSVCAVRTGAGKSQTSRRVAGILRAKGRRVVSVRHPMPYGDLVRQRVQRFAAMEDLDRHRCTIEEREEYEPHIAAGGVIYAGVDYGAILAQAQEEADVLLWDGGNNDLPFYKADLEIVVADPLRPGHERTYHPGEANLRRAHVVVINKIDSAGPEGIEAVRRSIRELNPKAMVVDAASPLFVAGADEIRGKRVLAVEDGPTLTHGEMKYGAGVVAALKHGAAEIVDPRPYTVGTITRTFEAYPGIGTLLPAMGYGEEQMKDLEATIERTPCDVVLVATPIDLRRVIEIRKPALRVGYELQEIGKPDLADALARF